MVLLPGCKCCGPCWKCYRKCVPVWSGGFGCDVGAVDLLGTITVDWSAAQFEVTQNVEPWPGDGTRPSLEMWDIYFPKQYDVLEIAEEDRAFWKHVTIAQGENPDIPVDGWGPTEVLNWSNANSFVDARCRSDGDLSFSCSNSWEVLPLPEYLTSQKYFFLSDSCWPPTSDLYEFDLFRMTNNFDLLLTDEQVKDLLKGKEVLPAISGNINFDFSGFSCGPDLEFYILQSYETPSGLDGLTQRPKMKMVC